MQYKLSLDKILYEFENREIAYRKNTVSDSFNRLLATILDNKDKIALYPTKKHNKDVFNKKSKFITGIEFLANIDDPDIVAEISELEREIATLNPKEKLTNRELLTLKRLSSKLYKYRSKLGVTTILAIYEFKDTNNATYWDVYIPSINTTLSIYNVEYNLLKLCKLVQSNSYIKLVSSKEEIQQSVDNIIRLIKTADNVPDN